MDKSALPKFDCYSDPATLGPRWTRWLNSFQLYADGKGLIINQNSEDAVKQRRRALLLHLAGPDVQDIFSTLPDTGPATNYGRAVTALNNYFVPQVNTAFARQTFLQVAQKGDETVQQFVTRLRQIAKDCDFGADRDNQIRDAVLSKCTSDYVRRKLLEEGHGLTLTRTLEIASQCERIEEQMAALSVNKAEKAEKSATDTDSVNRVAQNGGKPKKRKNKDRSKHGKSCYRCGEIGHFGRDLDCPARGRTCHKCKGKDHFSKMCKSKGQVNQVDEIDEFAFIVTDKLAPEKLEINLGGINIAMLIDSGASSNIVDVKTWEYLKAKHIKCNSVAAKADRKLYAYASKEPLSVKGTFTCDVKVGKQCTQAEFLVINGSGVPLLGKQTAIKLGVLRIGVDIANVTDKHDSLKQQFPNVFKGVGKLNTKQVTLHIDPQVEPVAQPLRRIPFNLRDAVDNKIKELLDSDIIEPVEGPTPWVNPMVIVPKNNGDIRLCLDMRRANEAIIRGRYPIPTVDEILQGMNGSTVFSKLDLKWGYHQLELTPESRGITTFSTHSALYRYKRLLFGVSSASELYQHEIAAALAGIEGVENLSDDIIVHGPNQRVHDERLTAVLQRLELCGLTLNPDKCECSMDRLVFMGILLSEKGIGPTEERVRAIAEARAPENAAEVRSFLGLVSYSSRFIPQFATISEPLRRLTRKDVPFEFGDEQVKSFNALKQALAKAGTLAYFDKNAPTKVIADASPVGLGAVLVQEQRGAMVPICYVSRSLSHCERKYSQTEREALGLVWACEKLHPYLYGRKFDLVTDHKPLEAIYSPHSKPCARVERWVLRLQPYDFNVVHIPGRDNIADPLSRLLGQTAKSDGQKRESDEYVRFVAVTATPKALTTREVEEASASDDEMTIVRDAIRSGCFDRCKQYAPISNELCVIGYIVLRGTRIVLPESLRPRALSLAHEGHLGIVGTKQHLRSKVWWPGMDRAAEKHCKSCHGCQLVTRPDLPEPLRPTPLPDGPWQDLAVDLLGPLPTGHSILVVVDYYSRYYEYDVLMSTTACKVIDSLETIFSRHGLPVTVKSDNGPQFVSDEFREFCATNGIQHVRTTPKWAQANGEVERQNSSLLKRVRIAHAEGLDWKRELRKYVTIYRGIDHTTTGKSPAELLFNRKMRGKLPEIANNPPSDTDVRDRDAERKGLSKLHADERHRARYSDVEVGDNVLLKQDKVNKFTTQFDRTPHKVVSKAGNNVVVESPTGAQYSRNTSFVKKYIRDDSATPAVTAAKNDVVQHPRESGTVSDATPPVTPTPARPRRLTKPPLRLFDYVVN